jgi:phosphoribosylamine--glycine ligase
MRVLVIGSGGREHALAWKIAQSPLVKKVFCAPGNAGTVNVAENIDIPSDNIDALLQFATVTGIGLTIVGPEQPLVKGLVDSFEESKYHKQFKLYLEIKKHEISCDILDFITV